MKWLVVGVVEEFGGQRVIGGVRIERGAIYGRRIVFVADWFRFDPQVDEIGFFWRLLLDAEAQVFEPFQSAGRVVIGTVTIIVIW